MAFMGIVAANIVIYLASLWRTRLGGASRRMDLRVGCLAKVFAAAAEQQYSQQE